MKKLILLFVSLLMLAACHPKQKQEDVSQATAEKSFNEMTEEERNVKMIELIEAEEARMQAAGEL